MMAVLTLGFQDKTFWFWNGIINYFLYFWVGKIDFIIIFFYVHTPHDVTLFILLSWLIRLGLFFSISMSKLVGKSCIDSLSVLKPIHCRSPFFFLVKDQFFVSMFSHWYFFGRWRDVEGASLSWKIGLHRIFIYFFEKGKERNQHIGFTSLGGVSTSTKASG